MEGLSLGPWASQRRAELLELLDRLGPRIEELDQGLKTEVERRPEAVRRMEQKGVGPVTALAFVLTLGPVERFANSRALVSYLGLNPSENSSGGHQRLGHISKQGNQMLRWLLVQAGHGAAHVSTTEVPAGREHCQGGLGSSLGGASVLDVAPGESGPVAGSHAR